LNRKSHGRSQQGVITQAQQSPPKSAEIVAAQIRAEMARQLGVVFQLGQSVDEREERGAQAFVRERACGQPAAQSAAVEQRRFGM